MNTNATDERRIYQELRDIFPEACQITAAFFDPKQSWSGRPQTMLANRSLREHYPHLNDQDFAILCSAVTRFHCRKC